MGKILKGIKKEMSQRWQLYVLMILPMLYLIFFKYYPMLGVQIAFKNYVVTKGIWGSDWVGLKHFIRFIKAPQFLSIIKNTLVLSVYQLLASFPLPIILALSINYVKSKKYKKVVQLVTYAPHFISVVVMVGIIMKFFSMRTGLVNMVITNFGGDSKNFLGDPSAFRHLFVWTNIWQNLGYSSIIYIAALSSIPNELHEAAVVDGANKIKRMLHIDLPGILPTAVILLIMQTGQILNIGFEKVLLMQNNMNIETSEIIDTYVYKVGLASSMPNFSYPTAIGLFKSLIALLLIISVNKIAKKLGETSLW